MVIGNGMIAKAFELYKNREDFCIFASGVSNSKEVQESAYKREQDLLMKTIKENRDKIFVYFSTCSCYDKMLELSPYIQHKKNIEAYIMSAGIRYYIFRVAQVVGPTNNETLVNAFCKKIEQEQEIVLFGRSTRNLIDIDDVYKIVNHCICNKYHENEVINLASPYKIFPMDIVTSLESLIGKEAKYTVVDIGDPYDVDISKIEQFFDEAGISFCKTYPHDVIHKYYNLKLTA